MLTPQQRAEKIIEDYFHFPHPELTRNIAAQIEEAEREATLKYANEWLQGESNEMGEDLFELVRTIAKDPSFTRFNLLKDKIKQIVMVSRKEGFSAAREMAKGILDELCLGHHKGLAERIEKMEPEKE